jgi:predicted alpha-1,2-mannosidase
MQFTFPETDKANVVIDAFDNASFVKIIPEENKVIGYSTQIMNNGSDKGRVPENFKNYFVIVFDKPFKEFALWSNNKLSSELKEATSARTGAIVSFSTKKGERITARIASSFISPEQAEINLKREIGTRNLAEITEQSKAVWNKHFNRFAIEDASLDDLDKVRMFYTALYRTLLFPREFFEYDANNNIIHYSPFTGQVLPGRMYTDNGFWDTFRGVQPFMTLFYPTQSKYLLEGLVNTYKESGWLPEWASPGHFPCMIGSNSASIIAGAYLNGVTDVDMNTLWEAVYKNAFNAHPSIQSVGRAGIEAYINKGYVPNDIGVKESAARTLEYAYNDYCVLKLAEKLNKDKKTIDLFKKRAMSYQNLFYKKHNLMAGKNSKGEFRPDFNPIAWGGDFTEGNSWHYSWSALHDPNGLVNLMGGKKPFVKMLDSIFVMPPVFDETAYGQVIHEIREMQIMNFGQYAHGNQPIQHAIYLYNWGGEPWKTQYWIRQVMDRLYRPTPDGYCGDEDNGQTSSWYLYSAMGFYPVCPVTGEHAIGSPLFRKMGITMESGKKLILSAPDNNSEKVYIDDIKVNGVSYSKNFFDFNTIQNGGNIQFNMSERPNTSRGVELKDAPYSVSNIIPTPNSKSEVMFVESSKKGGKNGKKL